MSDEELLETYRASVNKAMDEASARDGFATNMSRESIVAGLRAVFDMSKGEKRAEDEREALIESIRFGQEAIDDAYPTSDYSAHTYRLDRAIDALRRSTGPRPITDEMVAAADFAIMPYWGERYPSGSLTTEIARAALEAAEGARR